jgi:NHL repeat-containing protein
MGSRGVGDGQFNNPQSIASDIQGYLYVKDTNNHRIQNSFEKK